VTITVRARTRFDEPPMVAALALEVNGAEVGRFTAGVPDASTASIRIPAEIARRVFRRGFNQIGLRSLGVTPLDAGDPRPPGPLASRQGRPVWPVAIYNLEIE
jgi:hypothetical protein